MSRNDFLKHVEKKDVPKKEHPFNICLNSSKVNPPSIGMQGKPQRSATHPVDECRNARKTSILRNSSGR